MDGYGDEDLVSLTKEGNLNAFTELVRRYQKKVYKTIFHLTRNHHDSDDLAQETFMKAYASIKKFRQKSSFYTWLYRIAVNLTLNFLKKRSRDKKVESFSKVWAWRGEGESALFSPEEYSAGKELRERLKEALDSLPLIYKTSFILVNLQGMSHAQAAEVLRCSEKTVSWRIHKARKMLRERLKSFI